MNYELPEVSQFRNARRALPVVAALLFVAAILFPVWRIAVHAVQYPETVLQVRVYAYPRIEGDYVELARLNHYVGFYYPDPVYWSPNFEPDPYAVDVPEWSLGPLAFVAVGSLSLFVALAPTTEKLKRGIKLQLAGTVGLFAVITADIQYRLYRAGHRLDPDAPLIGVDPFTPPLWGRYEIANLTTYSRFGLGAYMAMTAIALLIVAYYYRETEVTVDELPARGLVTLLSFLFGAEKSSGPDAEVEGGDA
ncbi:hypothetical protein ACFR9U_10085 [Halorientalis brevis]|uniref:TIGR04206 family protein n=1 Tax=Halorientalis brevis TaxID=1126241 RepID=A0ABD6CBF0_9EURY|nr:hypothetical protein [Halorientalis brevis]